LAETNPSKNNRFVSVERLSSAKTAAKSLRTLAAPAAPLSRRENRRENRRETGRETGPESPPDARAGERANVRAWTADLG
jgi:hypothetical protein